MNYRDLFKDVPKPTLENVSKRVMEQLVYDLMLQKKRKWNYYFVRTPVIAPEANVPATIAVAADADFYAQRMRIVVDGAFTDDMSTIEMRIVDAGSMDVITREPVDIRTLASPGIYDPGSANEGNAHFHIGVPFPYLFRKNSNIQYDFTSTEAQGGEDHRVSVLLEGYIVRGWEDIPHNIG
jgi:hypothetical protein